MLKTTIIILCVALSVSFFRFLKAKIFGIDY